MNPRTDMQKLIEECAKAENFPDLLKIAFGELYKFHDGAHIVCGPISTGGRGSVEENLRIFELTIDTLLKEGKPIFSQMGYEGRIFFFRNRWREQNPSLAHEYYIQILEEFYGPIMRSGLIKAGWFIPGWKSSLGAQWERRELTRMGIKIHDLTPEWIDAILVRAEKGTT